MAAITTLGTLNAAISPYYPDGPRTDITAALLTDFLNFTQSKMYLGEPGLEPLRIRQMITSGTLTPATGGVVTISSGVSATWLEFVEITPDQVGSLSMNYREPWAFRKECLLTSNVGPQLFYTIEGDKLLVGPQAIATMTAYWYAKFAAISADSDHDWIIDNAPQIYLNGMLAEACAYFGANAAEEQSYRAKFWAGIQGLNGNDRRARQSGAPLRTMPRACA